MGGRTEQNSLTIEIEPGKSALHSDGKLYGNIMNQSQMSNKSRGRRNQSANLNNFGRER